MLKSVARTPETDPAQLAACRELLRLEGPFLRGDSAGQGERQVAAIERVTAALDGICDAFEQSLAAPDPAALLEMAEHLWASLDLAAQFKRLRTLGAQLRTVGEALPHSQLQALGTLGEGLALRRLGLFQEAAGQLQLAGELAARLERADLEAQALRFAGVCAVALGQTAQGRELMERALRLAESSGDQYGWAAALNLLGSLDFEQGNYSVAWERLGNAAQAQRRLGSLDSESRSIGNLAMLELRAGNHNAARELFGRALELKGRLGDLRGQAVCLSNLGSIELDLKAFAAARQHYEQARQLAALVDDKVLQASLLGNLGMLARDENDYILAATLLNVALELHRETANKLGEGTTLRFMAIVSLLQGDARQGAQYLTASLAIYREFGALREIVLSAGIAGTLLARQGDFARGAALLRTALHHEEQQGFRFEDDIKTILNSGLDEVRRAALAPDWPTAAVERAVRNCLDMDGGQLAGFTLDTLRERFRYDL